MVVYSRHPVALAPTSSSAGFGVGVYSRHPVAPAPTSSSVGFGVGMYNCAVRGSFVGCTGRRVYITHRACSR